MESAGSVKFSPSPNAVNVAVLSFGEVDEPFVLSKFFTNKIFPCVKTSIFSVAEIFSI